MTEYNNESFDEGQEQEEESSLRSRKTSGRLIKPRQARRELKDDKMFNYEAYNSNGGLMSIDPHEIPEGWHYELVSMQVHGAYDDTNIAQRLRMGWSFVPADRHPQLRPPKEFRRTDVDYLFEGGLVLMQIPTERMEMIKEAYQRKVDNYESKLEKGLGKHHTPVAWRKKIAAYRERMAGN